METEILLQKCLFVVIKHCHSIRKNSFDVIVDIMKTNRASRKQLLAKTDRFFFYTNRGSKPHLPIENLFDSCLGRCDGESQNRYTRKCPLCKLCLQDTQNKINIGIFPLNGTFLK